MASRRSPGSIARASVSPPPQMLHLGEMGVERGDNFRVHGTS
jgi:hypothetical protein